MKHSERFIVALGLFIASGNLAAQTATYAPVDRQMAARYRMPSKPAALYQYFAPRDSVDAATGAIIGASYLYVVYTPYATPASTGLTANPLSGGPWIMYPGKPWAHIMIAPQKTARVTY